MNNIDNAIAAASAAAANHASEAAPQGSTAVAAAPVTAVGAARPMTQADALAGMQIVDEYLKVSEFGLSIGANKGVVEEIKVRIDLSEVAYSEAIKFGNPATYEKTYDRVMAASGKTWPQALTDARRVDPRANPYRSADIAMELVDDVTLPGKGGATVEAGTTLGHSFSTTGMKSFAKLVKDLGKLQIDPTKATIEVTVGYITRSGNGNTWGVLDFKEPKEV